MKTLCKYVEDNFNGMLVIGDVHADYTSFSEARAYATANKLFLMSLGDLVDRGSSPFEVVSDMCAAMEAGVAGFTVGNHDDKFRRFYHGAKIRFSADSHRTLDIVGTEKQNKFLEMYTKIVEMPLAAGMYHTFGDISLVHAACHPCMWEMQGKIDSAARSKFLYGETNGEMLPDGYPVRLYDWIKDIPNGKTVIVGHDRMPIHNVPLKHPMTVSNIAGGTVVFIDTGCGKGGFLSGVVVVKNSIDRYVEFK